jgi:hypothetical protein
MTIERCTCGEVGFRYSIKASFVSNRELTASEMDNLFENIILQIQEPQDENQEDETYITSEILIEVVDQK